MKKLIFLPVIFFTVLFLQAQQKTIDSLLKVLKTAKEDTNKIHTLYSLSVALSDSDPLRAIEYANQSLSLSQKLGFKSGISISLNALGNANLSLSEYTKAMDYYQQRYRIASEMNDSIGIATIWDNQSIVYIYFGKIDTALELRKKSNSIYSSRKNFSKLANGYIWVGNIYKEQGNYSAALDYYFKGLRICTTLNDSLNIGFSLLNISSIFRYTKQFEEAKSYALQANNVFIKIENKEGITGSLYRLSLVFYEQKSFDSSIKYLFKAKKIAESIQDKYSLALISGQLGDNFLKTGDLKTSLVYSTTALGYSTQLKVKQIMATSSANMGIVFMKNKNYSKALNYFNTSQGLLIAIQDKDDLKDLSANFIEVYSQLKKPDSVSKYFNLYQQLSDTLYNTQSTKSVSEMEAKYETEKKEKENISLKLDNQTKENDLKQQRILKFVLLGGILTLIVIIYLVNNRNKVKATANNLVQQNKFIQQHEYLKQQISNDLHDEIGSGLTQITMICNQGESSLKNHMPVEPSIFDKIIAKSQLLSENLNDLIWATNPQNASLSNLVLKIRTYTYEFINSSAIDLTLNLPDTSLCFPTSPETSRNIFLILKEGLHNIIKHSKAKKIEVAFSFDSAKNFILAIRDNGIGFDMNIPTVRNGRKGMEKRIASIKDGQLSLTSIIGEGTTLKVTGHLG